MTPGGVSASISILACFPASHPCRHQMGCPRRQAAQPTSVSPTSPTVSPTTQKNVHTLGHKSGSVLARSRADASFTFGYLFLLLARLAKCASRYSPYGRFPITRESNGCRDGHPRPLALEGLSSRHKTNGASPPANSAEKTCTCFRLTGGPQEVTGRQ